MLINTLEKNINKFKKFVVLFHLINNWVVVYGLSFHNLGLVSIRYLLNLKSSISFTDVIS